MITTHHDGHGLNEALVIQHDPRDPNAGGASHQYAVTYVIPPAAQRANEHGQTQLTAAVADIQFQHGARNLDGSKAGVTEAVLLAILIDRLRAFQAGPFPSRQNAIMLTKLEECLFWTKDRADERARRGVLGTNQK